MYNKKAQFYIFTAIILCALLLGMVSSIIQKREEIDYSQNIKQNYQTEISFAINSALYSNDNISSQFHDFNTEFIDYTKSRGIDFELLSVLIYDDKIEINNYLNSNVTINDINVNQNKIINRTDTLIIEVDEMEYQFDISEDPLQTKSILRISKNKDIRVYILE